ncbi:M15 family metallopeptidase [Pseudotenacibaculum sp. MALMAid0570]|uniref:M15 family metallopeptidase n=1 Tax=Pseudotenacibaculum sp. MALMAid0570 TaxID=3143938 RepID=UPI0032DE4816
MKKLLILISCVLTISCQSQIPKGFSYLSDIDSTIQSELRYITHNNFIGKPIDGYDKNTVIITTPAAKALHKVQSKLADFGLSLKVFDAYRPQRAVDHFVRWAKVLNDTVMKQEYYPDVAKKDLFKLDYIASKSGHTRGSTVDLTIVDTKTGKELDMGSSYDFFGTASHPFYTNLTKKQRSNRLLLRNLMLEAGFKPYAKEWWHFTLKEEPYPETYFDFPIK